MTDSSCQGETGDEVVLVDERQRHDNLGAHARRRGPWRPSARHLALSCLAAWLLLGQWAPATAQPAAAPPVTPTSPAAAATPANLAALVREWRLLRESRATLEREWLEEQQRLAMLAQVEAERATATQVQLASLAERLAAAQGRLSSEQSAVAGLADRRAALLTALQGELATLAGMAPRHGLTLEAAALARLRDKLAPATLGESLRQTLGLVQGAVQRGLTVGVERGVFPVLGEERRGLCLRLGGAVEYFVSPEGDFCAIRLSHEPWAPLPGQYAPALRQAAQVASKDLAPELVRLPLPAKAFANEPVSLPEIPAWQAPPATPTPAPPPPAPGGKAFELPAVPASPALADEVPTAAPVAKPRSLPEAIAEAQQMIATARAEMQRSQTQVQAERLAWRQYLGEVRTVLEARQGEQNRRQQALATSERQLSELRQQTADQRRDEQRWQDSIRAQLEDTLALRAKLLPGPDPLQAWLHGLTTPGQPADLPATLGALLAGQRALLEIGAKRWRGLATVYREHGEAVQVETMQIGVQGGVAWLPDGAGLLGRQVHSPEPVVFQRGLTGEQLALLAAARQSELPELILDLSGGQALAQLGHGKTWQAWFAAGGLVMWPLALIAVLALLMIAERVVFFTVITLRGIRLERQVPGLVTAGRWPEAQALLAGGDGPMKRVWRKGLELIRAQSPNLEEALQEAILAEVPVLERFLSSLAACAAVAPLLGLLGTVSGMIKTFDTLTLHGSGNAGMLAGGISEALITTEAGLAVAIPILLAHAALNRRARVLLARMDQAAMAMIEACGRARQAAPAAPPPASGPTTPPPPAPVSPGGQP